jgi:outer membrane protein OmpA-like peptidoglycan-associated protein
LGRARALRLLSELEAGLHPVLRYQDWIDGRDVIQVRLSAVSFLDSATPFRQCLKTLLPFDFDDIRLTRVHFDTDKHKLNAAGRRALDRIVLYLKAGGVIQQVLVRGHTDWVGRRRYNNALSKRRAASVRAYLTEKEVPDALIQNSHFGESRPLASNKTTTGRAANRRVTLELTQ